MSKLGFLFNMEKIFKIRRVVFTLFLMLFTIGAVFISFYSRGLSFNLKTFRFQKTGAIFIETKPKNVLIKIDGKVFPDQSGPISSGTLIRNLLPGIYKIDIEKDGFYPWSKNLEVKPAFVTEATRIILIPRKINKEMVFNAKKVSNFWVSLKGKIISSKDNKLYLYNSADSIPIKLKADKFLGFNSDETKVLLQDTKTLNFYISELQNSFSALNLNVLIKQLDAQLIIKKASFHPFALNKVILETKNGLIIFELDTKKIERISEQVPINWTLNGFNLYVWRDNILEIFNLMLKTKSTFEDPNLTQILKESKLFRISPNNQQIAFLGKNNGITIFFLKEQIRSFNKKAGEVINLKDKSVDLKKEIENICWYFDSAHLFIESSNGVDFVEVDEKKPINQNPILQNISQLHYEISTNTIYFLEDNWIYKWQMKY